MIQTAEAFDVAIVVETADPSTKSVHRQMLRVVGKNETTFVHDDIVWNDVVQLEASAVAIDGTLGSSNIDG